MGDILAFGLVFFAGEVVFVLSQPVAGTQVAGAIFLVDRKVVVDAELDHHSLVTG